MAKIESYKNLIVWQKSIILVKEVYQLTKNFPRSELYGLTSQMRRSAISIPSNIAEGYGRKSTKEYAQFYGIAFGSARELETQLIIARELQFINVSAFAKIDTLLNEILRMLNTMIQKIRSLIK
ncbi:MAG: four helix bundle protein [Candidatus Levybacteria bacterium]|nr:four helix bundle protein [Candidatus Levybacteria bacterium]